MTPHGKAAIRDIEQRRAAALTPGRDRRRSLRQQRETPRDFLRELSRTLAPRTQPIVSSPQVPEATVNKLPIRPGVEDEEYDEPPPKRPRLSLSPDDSDDQDEDDTSLRPPAMSGGLEEFEDNDTQKSIEAPRRAATEQPYGRLSRGSFGSIRFSDRFADVNELVRNAFERDVVESSLVGPGDFDNYEDAGAFEDEAFTEYAKLVPRK